MAAFITFLRRLRGDSGAELVEFALTFPLLLLVVLGIVDFGLLFQRYEVITNAAREGARIAALPDYQSDLTTNVETRVYQYLDAANMTDGGRSVSVDGPTSVAVGPSCIATYSVTVTYPETLSFVSGIIGYFGGSLPRTTVSATATMRAEAAAGGC